jgi:hypothetical protein
VAWIKNTYLDRSFGEIILVRTYTVIRGSGSAVWEVRRGVDRSAIGTLVTSGTASSSTAGHEALLGVSIPTGNHIWLNVLSADDSVDEFALALYWRMVGSSFTLTRTVAIERSVLLASSTYQGLPLVLNFY